MQQNVSEPSDRPPPVDALADDLLALMARMRERHDEDPFGNPVLSVSLAISRRLDRNELSDAELTALIAHLRDLAFAARAGRIADYVGLSSNSDGAALDALAARLVRPDPADSPVRLASYRALIERSRFAAVFTAHPTFSLPSAVAQALAKAASGRGEGVSFDSHRPTAVTLEDEFTQAVAAIGHGRDALDRLNAALLTAARSTWAGRWADLVPRPVILASWVGYDTDGRTDIGWHDTLRLRLRMKHLQLARVQAQAAAIPAGEAAAARAGEALAAVAIQLASVPTAAEPEQVAAFAQAMLGQREAAMTSAEPLDALLTAAIEAAPEADRVALAVARAGLRSHGLSLAHTHVRLNATQLHNVVRQRLGLSDPPEDASRRRALLTAINAALDEVRPIPVDFGGLMVEGASAAKLMMTVAQLLKHIDASTPVRFLIAETESGYTLLAALWLARLFGVERQIEISPLFETAEALEQGARVLEEALRSPHWRAYLRATGRLALQFGYSDSGRYVGPLAATYLIERLRLKASEALARHGLTDVEIVLFDTHGESVGRGAHPASLSERLRYLSPPITRRTLAQAGIAVREESAFQGGDGYLLFGTPELALATVTRLAEHAFADASAAPPDPIYDEPDFSADFFAACRAGMGELVDDAGYAGILGAFGPALLDPTGSRPAARQTDGMGGPALIRKPSELRAIPNNAILHQIGWLANTLQGLGAAAGRHPEVFAELRESSPRFRNALDLPAHALAHADLDVLRAVVDTLDPGMWLDRAAHARLPGRRNALVSVARSLEQLDLWASAQAMFRRIQADHVALRAAWPDAPRMQTRELLLHALRLALVHRIWLLASSIPEFSPRYGVTRAALEVRILRLDIPAAVKLLSEMFPLAPDPAADRDYGEPRAPDASAAYRREHAELFQPMLRLFAMVREISAAITHEVGAHG